ncbi:MAG: methyltransferase domain-containing protein [Saprospiraceae bacterium]
MNLLHQRVQQQYYQQNLYQNILNALTAKDLDLQQLHWQDLKAVDEFHVGGLEATKALAAAAKLQADTHLLDVGCGIGGAARFLAAQYHCKVVGVDLLPEYILTAQLLTQQVGLADQIQYFVADALALPFANETFHVVWTQHVQMNIADKPAFYQELARVLQKDGRLLYYDVFKNTDTDLHFPLPWANNQQTSFLISQNELKNYLHAAHLVQIATFDFTAQGISSLNQVLNRIAKQGIPDLSLQLLMGDTFTIKLENLLHHLQENNLVLEAGIYQKMV